MEYCGGGSLQDIYHGTVDFSLCFNFYFNDCYFMFLVNKGYQHVDVLFYILSCSGVLHKRSLDFIFCWYSVKLLEPDEEIQEYLKTLDFTFQM